ncbi:MAG: Calx-beta domain-containing protein [Gemmataceae bacterium]
MVSGSVWSSSQMSALSIIYAWGDGNTETLPPSATLPTSLAPISASHIYAATGGYSITVTANATYTDGTTDSAFGTYSVSVVPPSPPPPTFPPPTVPPPPPVSPPPIPDVRVQTIQNTSEATGSSVGQFNLVRTGDLTQSLKVNYQVAGTAISDTDYNSIANAGLGFGSVEFAAGAATATITVTVIDDNLRESSETVIVTLMPSPLYHVLTPAGMDTLVIDDNDIDAVADSAAMWVGNPVTIAGTCLAHW